LPVIEKIAGKKLSPKTIEACIKESERILAKPEQPDENQKIINNNSPPQNNQSTEQPKNNKPNTTNIDPNVNTTPPNEDTHKTKTVAWANISARVWASKDGIFRTHARFVALINGQVLLERLKDANTGKTIKVDIDILRQLDIDTIEAIRKRYKELKAEGKPLPDGMIFDPL
jgi:hypothetical protein